MTIQAILFDAYGTLFDVYSIGTVANRVFPGKGTALAELWRDKQIEYTRLRTLCSMYKPFWELTQDALLFSCRTLQLELTIDAQNMLMRHYAKLQAFSESPNVLTRLRAQGVKLAILSNGNPEMLHAVVHAAGMQDMFSHVLSVDSVKKYKPASDAYQLGLDVFGLSPKNMLFVSGNCWDVCGASWFGYTTFWINRANKPLDELGVQPDGTGSDMNALMTFIHNKLTVAA